MGKRAAVVIRGRKGQKEKMGGGEKRRRKRAFLFGGDYFGIGPVEPGEGGKIWENEKKWNFSFLGSSF